MARRHHCVVRRTGNRERHRGRAGPAIRESIESNWSGSLRPGVDLSIDLAVDEPSPIRLSETRITLKTSSTFLRFTAFRPGSTTLRITAPANIENSIASIPIRVNPWPASVSRLETVSPYLVARALSIRNPRQEATTFTLRSDGPLPVWLGLTVNGPDAPRETSLSVTLSGYETRDIFAQLTVAGENQSRPLVKVQAVDFEVSTVELFAQPAVAGFVATQPLSISRAAGIVTVSAVLGIDSGAGRIQEMPLGDNPGPSRFEVRSSSPQIVGPVSIDWRPGESRRTLTLPLLGTGDAVLTLVPPPNLTGIQSRSLIVIVRQ